MIVQDILSKTANGSVKIIIWKYETGEIILQTIWHNLISEELKAKEVESVCIRDYEIRLGVAD